MWHASHGCPVAAAEVGTFITIINCCSVSSERVGRMKIEMTVGTTRVYSFKKKKKKKQG